MKKTVLTFGLICGGILAAMMLVTIPFIDQIGYDRAEVVGYTSMVLAFLLVFFGIRSYRDQVAGGSVTFGRALAVGLSIVAVASVCHVIAWQIVSRTLIPDFGERYQAHLVAKARASGASEEAIEQQVAQFAKFMEFYKNPIVNVAITFLEPLPVGVVLAFVSAGVLRRRHPTNAPAGATARSVS